MLLPREPSDVLLRMSYGDQLQLQVRFDKTNNQLLPPDDNSTNSIQLNYCLYFPRLNSNGNQWIGRRTQYTNSITGTISDNQTQTYTKKHYAYK